MAHEPVSMIVVVSLAGFHGVGNGGERFLSFFFNFFFLSTVRCGVCERFYSTKLPWLINQSINQSNLISSSANFIYDPR